MSRIYESKIGKDYTWSKGSKAKVTEMLDSLSARPSKVSFRTKTTHAGSVEVKFSHYTDPVKVQQTVEILKTAYPHYFHDGSHWRGDRTVSFYPFGLPMYELMSGPIEREICHEVGRRIGALVASNIPDAANVWAVWGEVRVVINAIQRREEVRITYTRQEIHTLYPLVCEAIKSYTAKITHERATGRISVFVRARGETGKHYSVELRSDLYGAESTVKPSKLETQDVIAAANRIADLVAQGHKLDGWHTTEVANLMIEAYTRTINDRTMGITPSKPGSKPAPVVTEIPVFKKDARYTKGIKRVGTKTIINKARTEEEVEATQVQIGDTVRIEDTQTEWEVMAVSPSGDAILAVYEDGRERYRCVEVVSALVIVHKFNAGK